MKTLAGLAAAFGAGAAFVYLGDPRSGRARRRRLSDRATHLTHEASHAVDVAARDLSHREHGMKARAKGLFRLEDDADDVVVAERVRAKLGHVCSHPHAIEVHCKDGQVELSGDVLAYEHRDVVENVARVRGVRGVQDHLKVHLSPEGVPRLQGGKRRDPLQRWQRGWSPARRAIGTLGGLSLLASASSMKGPLWAPFKWFVRVGGAWLLVRGLFNVNLPQLFGLGPGPRGPGPRGIVVQKTIHVAAPVEEVYAFLLAPENFPRFMRHVRNVTRVGDGRYRWTVEGPAGIPFTWEATITEAIPNERISWRTVPGSHVENEGTIRFEAVSPLLTRAHVRLAYRPPAGMVGHALASLFGTDPKKELDDDLLRFVSLLEGGKTRGREGEVTVEDVAPVTTSPGTA